MPARALHSSLVTVSKDVTAVLPPPSSGTTGEKHGANLTPGKHRMRSTCRHGYGLPGLRSYLGKGKTSRGEGSLQQAANVGGALRATRRFPQISGKIYKESCARNAGDPENLLEPGNTFSLANQRRRKLWLGAHLGLLLNRSQ